MFHRDVHRDCHPKSRLFLDGLFRLPVIRGAVHALTRPCPIPGHPNPPLLSTTTFSQRCHGLTVMQSRFLQCLSIHSFWSSQHPQSYAHRLRHALQLTSASFPSPWMDDCRISILPISFRWRFRSRSTHPTSSERAWATLPACRNVCDPLFNAIGHLCNSGSVIGTRDRGNPRLGLATAI